MLKTRIFPFFSVAIALLTACDDGLQVPQRERIDLSGEWQTNLGLCRLPGTTDENRLGSGQHATDVTTQLTRLFPFEGIVRYERDVEIPSAMTDRRLTLILERTKPSLLIVDGDTIGHHDHLYAPHRYVLPQLTSGRHRFIIEVDNRPESVPSPGIRGSHAWTDATQTNWNGILGDFCIEATPRAFFMSDVQVYPDVAQRTAEVRLTITAERHDAVTLRIAGESFNTTEARRTIGHEPLEIELHEGENRVAFTLDMGDAPLLWSEFHPALYRLGIVADDKDGFRDAQQVTFGMREFATRPVVARQADRNVAVGDTIGWHFTINGRATFLRGKHDGCVFPLTGYAPMDVASWRDVFRTAKSYGINHYRCHSYTPPHAAFLAADLEGIYIDTELPYWGAIGQKDDSVTQFLLREGLMTLDCMGNSPSFMMLGLGNELGGEVDVMRQMVDSLRRRDSRHLYNFGANDFLGWRGPLDGEDCLITCRIGGWVADAPVPDAFASHVRSSFSFADADDGGLLNALRPATRLDYTHAVRRVPRPVVSHETCQFQSYPDYAEIEKYTGVLYPYNLEVFRQRLIDAGLSDQAELFHWATGEWAMDCCKADIEQVLRTPGMAGFQMLDLQDYPGQGSALCGVLDAFMESKGYITDDEFRQFCAPVVPLALMDSLCAWNDQPFNIDVALCNYLEGDFCQPIDYRIEGDGFVRDGLLPATTVANGEVRTIGRIALADDFAELHRPTQLTLTLRAGDYANRYRLWVYPHYANSAADNAATADVLVADRLSDKVTRRLNDGGRVLLVPRLADIAAQSVGGLFTPDYWNYAMFKTISENNGRPVSPGTLGLLFDARRPLFADFPGNGRSDWQWWSIVRNSRALVLDSLADVCRPLIQVVDNVERNHLLGLLVEMHVDGGSLLICPTDLDAIGRYPEGDAYRRALMRYAASADFAPRDTVPMSEVRRLLNGVTAERDIRGVQNLSDYKQP